MSVRAGLSFLALLAVCTVVELVSLLNPRACNQPLMPPWPSTPTHDLSFAHPALKTLCVCTLKQPHPMKRQLFLPKCVAWCTINVMASHPDQPEFRRVCQPIRCHLHHLNTHAPGARVKICLPNYHHIFTCQCGGYSIETFLDDNIRVHCMLSNVVFANLFKRHHARIRARSIHTHVPLRAPGDVTSNQRFKLVVSILEIFRAFFVGPRAATYSLGSSSHRKNQ